MEKIFREGYLYFVSLLIAIIGFFILQSLNNFKDVLDDVNIIKSDLKIIKYQIDLIEKNNPNNPLK